MSWDGYREVLRGRGVERCGIFGKEDGVPWFEASLDCDPVKVKNVKDIFEKKDDDVYQNGIEIDGVKWAVVILDKEKNSLVLRGKGDHKSKSMCCCMTNQSLIIGTSECDKRAQEVAAPLEEMQQYMQGHGF